MAGPTIDHRPRRKAQQLLLGNSTLNLQIFRSVLMTHLDVVVILICIVVVVKSYIPKIYTNLSIYFSLYLESPKTVFFSALGLMFLCFCSKNAFAEMRTQKRYMVNLHPDASGADA